jgi:hypothetical protein
LSLIKRRSRLASVAMMLPLLLFGLLWVNEQAIGQTAEIQPERSELTHGFLLGKSKLKTPVHTLAYTPRYTPQPANQFDGRLTLDTTKLKARMKVGIDRFGRATEKGLKLRTLPAFSFDFVQSGNALVPLQRGIQSSEHPAWHWVLEPGAVWDEAGDEGWSRASLPFALVERNANCTHNGLLTFVFKSDGSVSRVAFQIGSETCYYFQFNLWGLADAQFQPMDFPNREAAVREYRSEVAAQLPIKPIAALAEAYPQVNLENFSLHDANDVSTYGFVIDGVNYSGGCNTRFGPYPFCEVLDLPSYSLAKTMVAGSGLMLLEQHYPGAAQAKVSDLVPECSGDKWMDVTLENLVDMASGNYSSTEESQDEFVSYEGPLFGAEDHAAKIKDSCTLFPRKAVPGSTFVYHTSDTYIAGTAMNAYLRKREGPDQDFFRDLVVAKLFQPLVLSQTLFETQRSYDQSAQPFSGFGLILHADDVVRYGQFLMNSNGKISGEQVLDAQLLAATLQQDPADHGLDTQIPNIRYNNGMWAGKVLPEPGCATAEWIPFMSGYGGISIALLPNDTVYYVFSDGAEFKWAQAATESDKLKPFCVNE